jgi:5-methylcytosine-specific restriction enzyme A
MGRLTSLGSPIPKLDTSIAKVPPKTADAHYLTPEHKAWRLAVLKRAAFKCQGPGPHNGPLHADHITEIRDGGDPLDPMNGQALCQACHNRKTAEAKRIRHQGW